MPPPVRVEQPAPEPMHAEPVTAEPVRAEPVRREPTVATIDPKVLLESAGLVMIETDRSKAPAVSAPVEEPLHLGRPRRERPKPQAADDELQQVETKR